MSVNANTYRVRSTLYGAQCYLGIIDVNNDNNIDYAGYKNAYSPSFLMPISEWNQLTDNVPSDYSYVQIAGTLNGFSDTSPWHTPLHIVCTNGSDYGIGFATWRTQRGSRTFYNTSCYIWTQTSDGWRTNTYISCAKELLESTDVAYNQLPEYIYLACRKNTNTTSVYYPYPMYGGYFYFDLETTQHTDVSISAWDTYLIPVLHRLELEAEDAPDPDPTPLKNDDPYAPGGGAWTGGGTGSFDNETEDVDIPNLPTLSASSTGFITLYNPSAAQLRSLASYMWSGLFDLDTYKKIFADPMSCILGLSIVPVNVPSGSSANVMVGNIDTGISMTTASSQYVEIDCGSVFIEEFWGAYLDYDPYTEIQIYLPYIGIHSLKADEVMNKTVTVKYHVDILSGACIAYVKCGSSVLYSFVGQCASSIPITGQDWTNVINGMVSIAGSIGSMVATGGASAPFALGSIASTAVNSMKPSIEKSGSLSGTGGLMGIQTPFLIITRPRQAVPERQNKFIGYPANITTFISSLSGYTEVSEVHLEKIHATSAELSEIENILKTGALL